MLFMSCGQVLKVEETNAFITPNVSVSKGS